MRLGSARMSGELTVALRAVQTGAITDLREPGRLQERRRIGHAGLVGTGAPARRDGAGEARCPRSHPPCRRGQGRVPVDRPRGQQHGDPAVGDERRVHQAVRGHGRSADDAFGLCRALGAGACRGAEVGFELSKIRADKDWALLLDIGAVVAGVDVANGKTQVLLFGARPGSAEGGLAAGSRAAQRVTRRFMASPIPGPSANTN